MSGGSGRRLVGLALCAALAACSGVRDTPPAEQVAAAEPAASGQPADAQPPSSPEEPTAGPSGGGGVKDPPPPPPPAPPAPPAMPYPVTVAFAGDVHGEPPISDLLADGRNPLADVAGILGGADIAVVNLETAVGAQGSPADKEYTFQAPPALLDALRDAGVDAISLANNHALDYGRDALTETVDGARARGLLVLGAGRDDAEAYAPVIVEVRGVRVALVGLSRVLPTLDWAAGPGRSGLASAYDEEVAVAAVERAAAQADHVVVVVHWGKERERCAVDHQLRLAEVLTRAGADVIAGHHAHVLQGIQTGPGTVVAYGLGNFVWYHNRSESARTGVLTVTLDETGAHDPVLTPALIDGEGSPRLLTGADATEILDEVTARSPAAGACPGATLP